MSSTAENTPASCLDDERLVPEVIDSGRETIRLKTRMAGRVLALSLIRTWLFVIRLSAAAHDDYAPQVMSQNSAVQFTFFAARGE
jgi:hypothetical protein